MSSRPSRPSFSGRFVEVKRATRTRRRKLVPKGRVLCALDDVIEIDGIGWVPVIYHGRLEHVKTETLRLIGRGPPSKKKKSRQRGSGSAVQRKKKSAAKAKKTAKQKRAKR